MKLPKSEKLIVALDLPNTQEALNLVKELGDAVSFYKIGLALIPIGGFNLAKELKQIGKKVFLDLKLFDIGHTIENTIRNLNDFNIDFLTVHGDPQVVRAATKARESADMKILAITLLTSMDREDLDESLIKNGNVTDLVVERARNALSSGADGVIASPNEAKQIKELKEATAKLIVTPGIRLSKGLNDDQKRISLPEIAFKNGSDYIVVGRPILNSKNPLEEVNKFKFQLT